MTITSSQMPNFFDSKAGIRPFYRLTSALIGILYSFLYVQIYAIMSVYWTYIGFAMLGYDSGFHYVGYIIVGISGAFVRADRRTPAEFIINLLYYVVYIPCIITPLLQGFLPFEYLLSSSILLGISFVFVAWFVQLRFRGPVRLEVRQVIGPEFFWGGVLGAWLLLNAYVAVVFGASLRFASFAEVYEQRFLADTVVGTSLVYYAVGNMACAINPLILALGLSRRSAVLVVMGISSQMLMYSTSALKAILVSTILTVGLHLFLSDSRGAKTQLMGPILIAISILGLLIGQSYGNGNDLLDQFMTLIFMRTTATPGVLYGIYLQFFSVYPTTSFSHVNIFQTFIEYPYGSMQIGEVIGAYVTPQTRIEALNMNANYLAADGIASFWLAGIPIVTIISALCFRLAVKFLRETDARLSCVSLVGVMTYLSNVSIFTAALTYGGILIVALLWLTPRSGVVLDRGPGWRWV